MNATTIPATIPPAVADYHAFASAKDGARLCDTLWLMSRLPAAADRRRDDADGGALRRYARALAAAVDGGWDAFRRRARLSAGRNRNR